MRFVRFFWIVPLLCLLWFRAPYDPSTDLQKWMDPHSKKTHVLATTKMCASLVEKVGGERVHVWTLIDEDLDPHSYQLVKGDKEKFRRADLVVANGLHLEHGRSLSALLKESKTLFLGDRIYEQSPGLFLPMDEGLDPHFWMDVSLFSKSVPYIVEALQQIDPDHSEEYATRGGELLLELDQLDHKIRVRMSKIPLEKRYLVTSHDAFQYFARRYLVDNGALGCDSDSGSQHPSPCPSIPSVQPPSPPNWIRSSTTNSPAVPCPFIWPGTGLMSQPRSLVSSFSTPRIRPS